MSHQLPIARILSSGSEIVDGLYADTNAMNLSRVLFDAGFEVRSHRAVGDRIDELSDTLRSALQTAKLVVMTGGLGPTEDDFTRDAVTAVYGVSLVRSELAERMMRERFLRRNVQMPERNVVQADIPEGAVLLPNHNGTAPGFLMPPQGDFGAFIALPGPPREWRPMMEAAAAEHLSTMFPGRPVRRIVTVHFAMTPESTINEAIRDLFHGDDPRLSMTILCGTGTIRVRAIGTAESEEEAWLIARDAAAEVKRRLPPEIIYGEGPQDWSLAQSVLDAFKSRRATIALAESCTGGLVAARITDLPGSSEVLHSGFVTYSNEAKIRDLHVPPDTIATHGAVSGECARAMAEGARQIAGTDVALSITGIAGPDGGSDAKPVGTVWFGLAWGGGSEAHRRRFVGDRLTIREWAVSQGLDFLRRWAKELPR